MEVSYGYLFSVIGVTVAATFLTRVIPFAFLANKSNHPLALHLGRYLPAGVMVVLVGIFLARSSNQWFSTWVGLDALGPALLVVAVHLWRGNALLSMLVGTLAYMFTQQVLV